jgi:signal peptidase II
MIISAIIIIFAVLLDQLTKYLAATLIPLGSQNIVVIPYLLELSHRLNPGASFGWLEGQQLLFMVITVVALTIFGYLFLDTNYKNKKVYSISIALFIAGTLGNAIDRALLGHVIDFMQFPFINPISEFHNNFADMYLSAAIVLYAIELFILEPKRTKKEIKQFNDNQS